MRMTFDRINRRTHLYLGMFLLPWFLMYGVSSIVFSHPSFLDRYYDDDGVPDWSRIFEREYHIDTAKGSADREIAARILRDQGIAWKGTWESYWPNDAEFVIYQMIDFWSAERVTYFVKEDRVLAEKRRLRWDHFLTGMHARGGFEQEALLVDVWAAVVDLVAVAIIAWITTGLIMFWRMRQARAWGLLALGGGALSMVIFLFCL